MKTLLFFTTFIFSFMCINCNRSSKKIADTEANSQNAWQNVLKEKMPLLGHRNWIVVTDMAYPLQTKQGIITLYANTAYEQVLSVVLELLKKAPHVYARAYQDEELALVTEKLCPGIDAFRAKTDKLLSSINVTQVKHENLIARLDSISSIFQVLLIKTNLTMPYTSTFFELDCKYWDEKKQKEMIKKNEL